jgi:hypothetical protein
LKEFGNKIKRLEALRKMSKVNIKEILKKANGMEREHFFGIMENTMRVNGKMGKSMAAGIGDQIEIKAIWANGLMGKSLGMGFILLKVAKNMRDNFKIS